MCCPSAKKHAHAAGHIIEAWTEQGHHKNMDWLRVCGINGVSLRGVAFILRSVNNKRHPRVTSPLHA